MSRPIRIGVNSRASDPNVHGAKRSAEWGAREKVDAHIRARLIVTRESSSPEGAIERGNTVFLFPIFRPPFTPMPFRIAQFSLSREAGAECRSLLPGDLLRHSLLPRLDNESDEGRRRQGGETHTMLLKYHIAVLFSTTIQPATHLCHAPPDKTTKSSRRASRIAESSPEDCAGILLL